MQGMFTPEHLAQYGGAVAGQAAGQAADDDGKAPQGYTKQMFETLRELNGELVLFELQHLRICVT